MYNFTSPKSSLNSGLKFIGSINCHNNPARPLLTFVFLIDIQDHIHFLFYILYLNFFLLFIYFEYYLRNQQRMRKLMSEFWMNSQFKILSTISNRFCNGAFIPLGFSMVGELFHAKIRGNKFGIMQFGLILGNGLGIMMGITFSNIFNQNGW
jgi:hypothetical protein